MKLESFATTRYRLEIESGDTVGRIALADVYSGVMFADMEYRYSALVESGSGIRRLEGLYSPELDEELPDRGGRIISITGRLGSPEDSPRVGIRHRFYLTEDEDCLDELIVLRNLDDADVILRDYRFAFRKRLHEPKHYGGPGCDIEDYRLIAVPFRLQPDGKKRDYQLADIYCGRYHSAGFPLPYCECAPPVGDSRARSEGWAWTDGEYGLLTVKYNPEMIEYSILETEQKSGQTCLNFGGASPCLCDEPQEARRLSAGEQVSFGQTRYQFYEGLWRRGSYLFREYLANLGHGLPDHYDPPLNWVVECGTSAECLDSQLFAHQFARAREIGCEALYLEPAPDISSDDDGSITEQWSSLRELKAQYNIKIGFSAAETERCLDHQGIYRRTSHGLIGFHSGSDNEPVCEPCLCSSAYREQLLERILNTAADMNFVAFHEFGWHGPCFDGSHQHPVPSTPSMHVKAVMDLVKQVCAARPDLLIETRDPVWPNLVRYLPVYYLHGPHRTFDEIWGFGFSGRPLEYLLSGRALSLFYYNLACEIPLHLHIDAADDNDNCLAFWWYASTVRHLGIDGSRCEQMRLDAYARAIQEYLPIKDLYTRGRFYGLDEVTHIHVLPEDGRSVVNAFNLTDAPVSREAELRPNELGLLEEIVVRGAAHEMVRGRLALRLEIPPFSSKVVTITSV